MSLVRPNCSKSLGFLEDRSRGLRGQNALSVDLILQRRQMLINEPAHGGDQQPLFLGKIEVHDATRSVYPTTRATRFLPAGAPRLVWSLAEYLIVNFS